MKSPPLLVETGGSVVGGFLGGGGGLLAGAPTGPGAVATTALGALLGAGLGNAEGSTIADALEEYAGTKESPTFLKRARDAGLAFANGAAGEATGQLGSRAATPLVNHLAPKVKDLALVKHLAKKAPAFTRQLLTPFRIPPRIRL